MKMKEMNEIVNILDKEWDLGKKSSNAKGKICAWIYLFQILEESEEVFIEKDNNKVIGICGYAKWKSKRKLLSKKFYTLLKNILIISPLVKNKKALYEYNKNYDYIPEELKNYFDGEISILIVDKEYRGKKIGKKLLLKIFECAKRDNMKKIQILTDESCNYKFYEVCGCRKIYETQIENKEQNKCGNAESEIGYIYEKRLD